MTKYLQNCFLLLIPILAWNLLFLEQLPKPYQTEIFWKDIPAHIKYPEHLFRILVFTMTLFMCLSYKSNLNKLGWFVFSIGIMLYFASWLAQMYYPNSAWSTSVAGFTAPGFTPAIWLLGIGMIGSDNFLNYKHFSFLYYTCSALFLAFHFWHSLLVFQSI